MKFHSHTTSSKPISGEFELYLPNTNSPVHPIFEKAINRLSAWSGKDSGWICKEDVDEDVHIALLPPMVLIPHVPGFKVLRSMTEIPIP
jgi:hypothetical protein